MRKGTSHASVPLRRAMQEALILPPEATRALPVKGRQHDATVPIMAHFTPKARNPASDHCLHDFSPFDFFFNRRGTAARAEE